MKFNDFFQKLNDEDKLCENGNLEFTFGNKIDENIFDKKIINNNIENLIPLITSIFNTDVILQDKVKLFYLNTICETTRNINTDKFFIDYKKKFYISTINNSYTINLKQFNIYNDRYLLKYYNKDECMNFQLCKIYNNIEKFKRLIWIIDEDINIYLDMFGNYNQLSMNILLKETSKISDNKIEYISNMMNKFYKIYEFYLENIIKI